MASPDNFTDYLVSGGSHNGADWLEENIEKEQHEPSAATPRPPTTMNVVIDEHSHVTPDASISIRTSTDHTMALTGQSGRHGRRHVRGGVEKTRTARPRSLRSPDMLKTLSIHGQEPIPAPSGYRSHAFADMYISQLEVPVASQEPDPRHLDQPFESSQSFGTTDNNRAFERNESILAWGNITFDEQQGSMRAAQSATPSSSFYTGPMSFETPHHPGRGHVMVRLWQNLLVEHSWYFQIEMDEFEIKFHHTPSTVKTAGMSSFKENWQQLEEYYLPILRIVIGDGHAFISQIPVFNRLLQTSTIDFLLGTTGFRTMNKETSSLIEKLGLARFMSNDEHLSASWKEKHEQATRDMVAKLHDWTLSLRVALKLVFSQDALINRKMVSYKRLAAGEISRSFGNLLQPEATVVYLPVE